MSPFCSYNGKGTGGNGSCKYKDLQRNPGKEEGQPGLRGGGDQPHYEKTEGGGATISIMGVEQASGIEKKK